MSETISEKVDRLETRMVELDVEHDVTLEEEHAKQQKQAIAALKIAKETNRKEHVAIAAQLARINALADETPVTLSNVKAKRSEGEPDLIPTDWEPNEKTKGEIEKRGLDYASTLAIYIRQMRESGKKASRFQSKAVIDWLDAQETDTSPPEAA